MSTRHSDSACKGRLSTAQQIRLADFLRSKLVEINDRKWTQPRLAEVATRELGFTVSGPALGRTARALNITWPGGNPTLAHNKRRSRLTIAEKRIAQLERALLFLTSRMSLHHRDHATIESLLDSETSSDD